MRKPKLVIGALAVTSVLMALSGCGTRISGVGADGTLDGAGSTSGTAGGGTGSASGDGSTGASGTSSGAGTTGTTGEGTGGQTGATTGENGTTSGSSGSSSSSSSSGSSGSSTGTGTGSPHSPVNIGFTTLPDAASFQASFGVSSSTGDQTAEIKAAVAWVNAHGGLAGHPIKPFIESLSITSSQSYDTQYQALCQKYTQDDHVVAATIQPTGADDNMDACMSQSHTLFTTGVGASHDQQDYQRHPYVVSPSEPTTTALARTMASMVLQRRAVPKGGKLGIINYDVREYNDAVSKIIKPTMASAGIGIVQYQIAPIRSTPEIGNAVSAVQSAELKMRSQNVQTVLFLCPSCLAVFAESAKQQGYNPAYVFSSMDTPVAGNDTIFKTSFGVGFSPVTMDQYVYNNPKSFTGNPTFDRCKKIETDAGQATSATSLSYAMALCDAVMSIYSAALANPVSPVTADSLRQGMLSQGSRYPDALSWGTNLTPQTHAGVNKYKPMQWSDACGCLAYYGPVLTFPRDS